MRHLRWENLSNDRYYAATLTQDLLGDWVIIQNWGSKTRQGRTKTRLCASYEEGLKIMEKINITRKKRGYEKTCSELSCLSEPKWH